MALYSLDINPRERVKALLRWMHMFPPAPGSVKTYKEVEEILPLIPERVYQVDMPPFSYTPDKEALAWAKRIIVRVDGLDIQTRKLDDKLSTEITLLKNKVHDLYTRVEKAGNALS